MDTTAIATAVTGCLAPALPYLIKAGEKGAEALGEKLGSGVWEKAKALWQMLSPVAETHPSVAAAAREMAEMPDDSDAQAALRFQLKKLLAADDQLAAALRRLLESAEQPTRYQAEVHGEGSSGPRPGCRGSGERRCRYWWRCSWRSAHWRHRDHRNRRKVRNKNPHRPVLRDLPTS